jgi:hypothetical protein
MSKRDTARELTLQIGALVVPDSYDPRDFAARLEREIADRRFGPGRDPVIAALATRLMEALDAAEETS